MAYTYILVDTNEDSTRKYYCGARLVNKVPPAEDLGIKYFTSSCLLFDIFRSDPDRFLKYALEYEDPDDALGLEDAILRAVDKDSRRFWYNTLFFGNVEFLSKKTRSKVSIISRDRINKQWKDPRNRKEFGIKVSKSLLGYKQTEEHKENHSITMVSKWKDPAYSSMMIDAQRRGRKKRRIERQIFNALFNDAEV